MSEDTKEIDRLFHIIGILDGKENFHSGHATLEAATNSLADVNEKAIKLNIRTRYIIRENKKTQ